MTAKRTFRFQCVDDDSNADALCSTLSEAAHLATLKIERRNPGSWEKEVAELVKQVKNGDIDGALLDYRLDEKADATSATKGEKENAKGVVPVGYTADALVQELRRRSVEAKELSFPIVLWSNAERLEEFHGIDPNFRQHYDWVIDKEKIPTPATAMSDTLISLARGYDGIRATKVKAGEISPFLKAPQRELVTSVDVFFKKIFRSGAFAYQTALFIIHELLESDGPLVGAPMLQALLAVNLAQLDSGKAKKAFDQFKYSGVFCEGFPRYWRVPLMSFLDDIAGTDAVWMKLNAEERAKILADHFGLRQLKAFAPIQPKYSSIYDTFCSHSSRPLNRMNGFALFDECPRIWKDTRFISAHELRRNYRAAAKNLRLEEGEERRFLAMFDGK
jgi:hypothetical protein